MRPPQPAFWVGTSWKMNKTLAEARAFAAAIRGHAGGPIIRFVIPPFTLIREAKALFDGTGILVGGQNMHWEDAGAWTGEISPLMLRDCGADLVEIGHSERRAHFGETDETVGRKVAAALRHGLTPLVCVGETAAEQAAGQTEAVLRRQVRAAVKHVAPEDAGPVMFAYEPVWAIGEQGVPASPPHADACHRVIRAAAAAILGSPPPVLYGGSVDVQNCRDYSQQPHIDGLFIGRSAWDPHGFIDIVERAGAAYAGRTNSVAD